MSGETEADVSGWTTDTLRAFILTLIAEHDKRYEQRFLAQEKAVTAALTSAERAVNKAEIAAEKRFDAVNEFRAQQSDIISNFLPRREYDVQHFPLVDRVVALERHAERGGGQASGRDQAWGYLIGAIGAFAAVASIVIAIIATR